MLNKLRYILKKRLRSIEDEYDVDLEQLKKMQKQGALLLDVRSPQEYKEGYLNGAILIPEYEIKKRAEKELKNKEETIIVYCRSGARSKKAQKELKELGYTKVYNLYNGYKW